MTSVWFQFDAIALLLECHLCLCYIDQVIQCLNLWCLRTLQFF